MDFLKTYLNSKSTQFGSRKVMSPRYTLCTNLNQALVCCVSLSQLRISHGNFPDTSINTNKYYILFIKFNFPGHSGSFFSSFKSNLAQKGQSLCLMHDSPTCSLSQQRLTCIMLINDNFSWLVFPGAHWNPIWPVGEPCVCGHIKLYCPKLVVVNQLRSILEKVASVKGSGCRLVW